MNREEASKQYVEVYWWNGGTKTVDHKGTYQEFMDKKGIKVEDITHPRDTVIKGLRFTHDWGSSKFIYEHYGSDIEQSYFNAIQMFMVIMGDRAKIESNRWSTTVNKRE